MKENLFKVSVSDWTLEFESGEIVNFITILEDTVVSHSSGITDVILKDACFNYEFVRLFENKTRLKYLKQYFNLVNSEGNIIHELEYGYATPEIKNISISGTVDSVATMNVSFTCL